MYKIARFFGKALYNAFLAVFGISLVGATIAVANYTVTQGAGTTFGSIAVATINYAQQLVCDVAAPGTCANVKAASTAAVAADQALVVAVSPNNAVASTQSGTWTVQQGTPPWAASVAAGADVTEGNTTDAACAGDNTSGCTIESRLIRIAQNLTTVDTDVKATGSVQVVPSSSSTTAGTTAVAGASVSNLVGKASAGNLENAYVVSNAAGWVFLINATSLPANATLTVGTASGNLQGCFELVKANTDWQATISYNPGPWEQFSTGITIGISSTACPTLTAATTSVYLHAQVN